MKRAYMGNQSGEVVTGVMVAIMVVMMFFGGMHMMHGDHRHSDDHDRMERKHDHQKEEMHQMHNEDESSLDAQAGEKDDGK